MTTTELKQYRVSESIKLVVPRRALPKSLFSAAGLLKSKYPDLKKHYKKIRKEWSDYSVSVRKSK